MGPLIHVNDGRFLCPNIAPRNHQQIVACLAQGPSQWKFMEQKSASDRQQRPCSSGEIDASEPDAKIHYGASDNFSRSPRQKATFYGYLRTFIISSGTSW